MAAIIDQPDLMSPVENHERMRLLADPVPLEAHTIDGLGMFGEMKLSEVTKKVAYSLYPAPPADIPPYGHDRQ